MSDFALDPRLASDCHILGRLDNTLLLLMDNALVPWMILVPMVEVTELHELEWESQLQIMDQINLVSNYLKNSYAVDKINVAAIGNIVRQLHIHVVGRSEADYCWPNVVWGAEGRKAYSEQEIANTVASVIRSLGDRLTPA
jgi:diadenosine tetraphosphate (Ap4A) HIT family hydrolase